MTPTKNSFGVPDFDPSKPLDFLDDKGNEILNKLLEGRSEQNKISMKLSLNMAFHYIPSLEHDNQLHYVSNISTDHKSIKNTMQDFYDNNKNGGSDTIGLNNIVKEFLSLYSKETTLEKTQFTEETKSKNLEQFYVKETQQKSDTTKVALEKTITKHESRYEALMKINHNNMTPAEQAEFSILSDDKLVDFLSDEAKQALNKLSDELLNWADKFAIWNTF